MKKVLLLVALALAAAPALAAGDGIHLKTLENGLQVIVKEDHSKPLAALRIYVKTGGAFEKEFLGCGISHYYEHLLSGGTTSKMAGSIDSSWRSEPPRFASGSKAMPP